jgi:hypothetical protein
MIEIVFVHLGPVIPAHLSANIKRIQRIWPTIRITLILDHILESPSGTDIYLYKRNSETQKIFSKSNQENDFWAKSLERLFALADYALSEDSQNVILHVESDVLLMPNFPFAEMSKIQQLTWNRYNDKKDVGALVLIPNRQMAGVFNEAIVKTVKSHPGITDMTLLSILSNELGVATTFSNHWIPENESYLGTRQSLNPVLVSDFKLRGIFDPAQIGMWIAGLDPRNTFGFTKYQDKSFIENGDSEIDPSRIRFTFDQDKYLLGDMKNEITIPIWCLHIHSKNLKLFDEGWADELDRLVSKSRNRFRFHWDIRMTVTLIIENYYRKTLIRYMSHLPGIRKGRMWFTKCYNRSIT